MLNEFSYKGKTYCIKTPMDSDFFADDAIKFLSLKDVRTFLMPALNDGGAWTVVMSIAKWNYHFSCRPPKRCPEPKDDEFFDTFCRQILVGELNLVEIKADKSPIVSIKDLRLKECCITEIQNINDILAKGNILAGVLIGLPVFNAFFYPPGYNQWASLASTVISISNEDWIRLVERIKLVPKMARKSSSKIAKYHSVDHESRRNDRQIVLFWRGIADVFDNDI